MNYTFITGASSGLGEETALYLSKTHHLILHGRDTGRLTIIQQKCLSSGNSIILFPYDFTNISNLKCDFSDFIIQKKISIQNFLHFAGMTEVLPLSRTKYTIGMDVMNVNYFSAMEIASALVKKKVNSNSLENIVFISSIVSTMGRKYQPYYCASKGAINASTIALACELAPKVRVNCITPGGLNTRMTHTLFSDSSREWTPPKALLPHYGVGEIPKIVKFLISDDSRYITGQNIYVDGGERFYGTL